MISSTIALVVALLISAVNALIMCLFIHIDIAYTEKTHNLFTRYVDEIKDILDDADHTKQRGCNSKEAKG